MTCDRQESGRNASPPEHSYSVHPEGHAATRRRQLRNIDYHDALLLTAQEELARRQGGKR